MEYQNTQLSMSPVINAGENARTSFLVRVYQHLGLAIGAFILFEFLLFKLGFAEKMFDFVSGGGMAWLAILGAFMIVNMIATQSAHNIEKPAVQYGALFAISAAYAIMFSPMLYFAAERKGSYAIWMSAVITIFGFAALTLVGFVTRKDLSFIRPLLMWGGISAVALIVASTLMDFQLGIIFSIAMVALSGASILYQTQKIVRQYPEWAFVGAAVGLFSSMMTMFWYILSIFLDR